MAGIAAVAGQPEVITVMGVPSGIAARIVRLRPPQPQEPVSYAPEVDLDDLYTYAHQSFDLERVREYRLGQVVKSAAEEDEWPQPNHHRNSW